MKKLGQLKRITDLRSIWAHEANDFTKWLAEEAHLAILSDSVGIDITFEERESSVGTFNVDLYATEEGTGRKIIIENQLETTNHDHLGKLITYASGKGAEIIIWIVKKARDEHKQAIEWLNQHLDENIGFFLVEIELWQIGDSPIAPKFNVVERPNDWAKQMKTIEGLSKTKQLQLEFWTGFIDAMQNNTQYSQAFSTRKAQPQHWYDVSVGSSAYHLRLTINTKKKHINAEIYISDDKEKFHLFEQHKEEINELLGGKTEWKMANKATRILLKFPININSNLEWPRAYDWLAEKALAFKRIARRFDR